MLKHARRLHLGVLVLTLAALLLVSASAAAHPLGNFTISHFSRLTVDGNQLRLHYALDFAEIPTYQELRQIDLNGDRQVDQSEEDAYLPGRVEQLRQGLHLTIDGRPVDLSVAGKTMKVALGQNGLRVMRIDADFTATLPAGSGEVHYQDSNFDDQPGWREIVVGAGTGSALTESNALATSASDELRSYPQDPSATLLDMRQVDFRFAPSGAAGIQPNVGLTAHVPAIPSSGVSGRLSRLVSLDHATPLVILVSLLAALAWGGAHALTPGHGKAVVAAYLVGARGTARHAVFLGLTVTLTHTAGVFALGAITLWLSRFILPARLYPWLTVLSGLLVVAIGVTLVWRRARGGHDHHHHEHAHDHEHPHSHAHGTGGHHHHHHDHVPTRITPRGLLALGVSGGLVPCPSALILLLSAISLGRVGYGIVLVLSFSLGLAGVLTGIGLLSVYARGLFQRFAFAPRLPRLLPLVSALAVTVAGLAIVAGSLSQTGLL